MTISLLKKYKHSNFKYFYYIASFIRQILPKTFYRHLLKKKLDSIKKYDREYIYKRVNFYNKLQYNAFDASNLNRLNSYKLPSKKRVYFFDLYEFTRYFNPNLRLNSIPGDVTFVPEIPSIVKSRPICNGNANSVLLKLNRIRHYMFVNDSKTYEQKRNMLFGRAEVKQEHRIRFFEMYFNHPMCNLGQINDNENAYRWKVKKTSIFEHLEYKFILCLEGYDVATNLKWVMSSNSLAVMPKPKFETWFMESTLIPNYHYIEIKDDFSDLEEKLNYYIDHPNEAKQIAKNANLYVKQFQNTKQEKLISLLVLKKYFESTGQHIDSI